MGRELAEKDRQFMDLWKKAEKISSYPLREIFWDGNDQDMSKTEFLQPALTVVNLNLWRFLEHRLKPEFMTGHSLGEFSALCAAKVISTKQAIELVSLRGRLMAESGKDSQGAMAAILKVKQSDVEEITREVSLKTDQILIVANYNTPKQFVVSGNVEAIEALEALVKEARGRLVKLPVSGAFHSPLMNEAARELSKLMDKVEWKTPFCRLFFNSTTKAEHDPEKIKKIMQKQMISPVYFFQIVQDMYQQGATTFVEIGPKGVLSRMIPQILGPDKVREINIGSSEEDHKLADA
ncbi:MAG: ACP S-malonyltransferase [Desulfonatronovibrio sp. MSAO_Bac4]|nr:MAG: ACP S-malonyltransferase [Desulfonatronovibrio sp. MSAO_Bac4]